MEIRIKIPNDWAGSIELTEYRPDSKEAKRKALEMVDKLFKPILDEGRKQCD